MFEELAAPGCRLQLYFFPLIVCVYLEIPLDGKISLVFPCFLIKSEGLCVLHEDCEGVFILRCFYKKKKKLNRFGHFSSNVISYSNSF